MPNVTAHFQLGSRNQNERYVVYGSKSSMQNIPVLIQAIPFWRIQFLHNSIKIIRNLHVKFIAFNNNHFYLMCIICLFSARIWWKWFYCWKRPFQLNLISLFLFTLICRMNNVKTGIKELELISIDPLKLEKFDIVQSEQSPVNIRLLLRNLTLTGLSDINITKIVLVQS